MLFQTTRPTSHTLSLNPQQGPKCPHVCLACCELDSVVSVAAHTVRASRSIALGWHQILRLARLRGKEVRFGFSHPCLLEEGTEVETGREPFLHVETYAIASTLATESLICAH